MPALCLVLGFLAVMPLVWGRHTVLIQDMLLAYYCYFVDFHRDFAWNHLPLWSSSYQGGMPMHAYWQSGWLYPVTWLCFGFLRPQTGLYVFYGLHFALAAFGFTVLGPRLRLTRGAALWAGMVFAYSGTLLARYEHPTFLAGWAYMPLVMGLYLRALQRPGMKSLAAYAAAFALQAYGGHPQATITLALALLPLGFLPLARWKAALVAQGLALLLCLPLFLPFLQLVAATSRYAGTEAASTPMPGGGKPPELSPESVFDFQEFSAGSLRLPHLAALVYPYALGSPAKASWWGHEPWTEVYLGLGGAAFLMLGFFSWRKANRDLRVLIGIGLAGLWLALGPLGFAADLTFHLPLLGDMRRPARYDILGVLVIAALSGFGFRRLAAASAPTHGFGVGRKAGRWGIPTLAAAHALGGALLIGISLSPNLARDLGSFLPGSLTGTGKNYVPKIMALSEGIGHDFLWMAAALGLIGLIWLKGKGGNREAKARFRWATTCLFFLLGLSLIRLHWVHFHPFPSDFYARKPETLAALDLPDLPFWRITHYLEYPGDSLWLMHHHPTARMDLYEREKAALSFGIHAIYGIRHVSAHLPLLWKWGDLKPSELSARYLLSDLEFTRFRGDSVSKLVSYGTMHVYAVGNTRPRLERLAGPRPPSAGLPAPMSEAGGSGPGRALASANPPASRHCPEGFASHLDLCARENRDGYLTVFGPFRAGDTLLFRERYWPGWQARLEGESWRSMRSTPENFAFLEIGRPAGKIELRYFPTALFRLMAFSGLAFAGLAWMAGRLFRPRPP